MKTSEMLSMWLNKNTLFFSFFKDNLFKDNGLAKWREDSWFHQLEHGNGWWGNQFQFSVFSVGFCHLLQYMLVYMSAELSKWFCVAQVRHTGIHNSTHIQN